MNAPGRTLEAREPEVQRVYGRTTGAIDHLNSVVMELADRLKPVLRDEPNASPSERPEQAFSTPMARKMMEHVRSIDEIAERVIYLNQHLEL